MEKKDKLTKFLAISGTILIWLPLLAPLVFSMTRLIQSGRFMFDYLMPAELLLFALAGAALLIWAAIRAHSRLKLIAWSFGLALFFLVSALVYARLTGLATGEIENTGPIFILLLVIFSGYIIGLIVAAVAAILLLRDVFKPAR